MHLYIIKLNAQTLKKAANEAGMTIENFVSRIRSISLGREVCAHFEGMEGNMAVFACA